MFFAIRTGLSQVMRGASWRGILLIFSLIYSQFTYIAATKLLLASVARVRHQGGGGGSGCDDGGHDDGGWEVVM